MRLDHYLSAVGLGTRSEVKKIISKGRITVDGAVCKDPACKVNADESQVFCDGKELHYEEHVYFMLNKPQGIISASRADLRNKDERCVVDLIEEEKHRELFPVGRLDKDTEGLLLITDDGALAHDLLSPKKHVDKTYLAVLRDELSVSDKKRIEDGIDIGDEKPTLPCKIEYVENKTEVAVYATSVTFEISSTSAVSTPIYSVLITIHEGRFHQVKRMFEAVGNEVVFLKRLSMGKLSLDENLKPSEYKKIELKDII